MKYEKLVQALKDSRDARIKIQDPLLPQDLELTMQVGPETGVHHATRTDERIPRELIRNVCATLSCRAFDPAADVRTLAEQLRQTGELVLKELEQQ